MRRPTTVPAALAARALGGLYGHGLYSPVWDLVSADVATGPTTVVRRRPRR